MSLQVREQIKPTTTTVSRKLEGKVAVVTGGSAGIGLGIAKEFASEGARVYIIGKAAVFLAASDSAYITGVELDVDGGVSQD